MKRVVFLSHSSKDNPRAIALQQALHAAGLATAFDVTDLRKGEEYRPQLYRWIARSHGAVLLLTEGAMAEPNWVLQEATLLRARTMLEGAAFKLCVLIDEAATEHAAWDSLFKPLNLGGLQRAWKFKTPGESIDAAVAGIAEAMQELADDDGGYDSQLANLIFDRLEPFVRGRVGTGLIARTLKVDDALWHGIVPAEASLQSLLARRLGAGALGEGRLQGLFQVLQREADEDARRGLFNALRSHWVPLTNARRLAEARSGLRRPADGEPVHNVLLLHTEYSAADKVTDLHRERWLQPFGELGKLLSVPPGNENEAVFCEAVRISLQQAFFDDEPDIPVEDIADERARPGAGPTFIHLAGVQKLDHVLPVARRFWSCLFVLTANAGTIARLAPALTLPPIGPSVPDERSHMRDQSQAFAYVRNAATTAARSTSP